MTTQLRLVEPPEPGPRPAAGTAKRSGTSRAKGAVKTTARRTTATPRKTTPGRATNPARTGRRSASWGDWHLDAGTRRVGREGVASARRALEAALEQELRAS